MPLEIITAGLNVVDILFKLPEKITPGTKHEVKEISVQGGAPAGNAACVMASLGKRVGYIARMGRNTLSDIARSEFTRYGVSDELFIDDADAAPAVAVVQADAATGERTVFYALQNYHHLRADDVPVQAVRDAKLVLVDGYQPEAGLRILSAAKDYCQSVVDLESGDPALLWEMLKLANHAVLPLHAAKELSGEETEIAAIKSLAGRTRAQLVITDGIRGCWGFAGDAIVHTPAIKVETVDTTGCGDSFHGAYCVALLDGWDLQKRMQYASFVASRVAMWLGGRKGLGTLKDSVRDWQR